MVSGLMEDTPLGRVVQLRTETDKNILRHFTPEQRRHRAAWASFKRSRYGAQVKGDINQLEMTMANLFSRR